VVRVIPFSVELETLLKDLKNEKSNYVYPRQVDLTLDIVKLNIEKIISFADLRKTFVLYLMENRVSLLQIYKILGLRDIAEIAKYMPFVKSAF
jgi:hypothetical protein